MCLGKEKEHIRLRSTQIRKCRRPSLLPGFKCVTLGKSVSSAFVLAPRCETSNDVVKGAGEEGPMEFGVHLPLLAFRGQAFSLSRLVDYADAAEQLGFTTLCANDHLTFSRPWLDSLTALASILTKTRHITLMTTVALPVVRGPIPLAKSLAALDVLSGGRLIAGVGPGSLPQDYALMGIAFEERWKRFEEAIKLLRRLLQRDTPPFTG